MTGRQPLVTPGQIALSEIGRTRFDKVCVATAERTADLRVLNVSQCRARVCELEMPDCPSTAGRGRNRLTGAEDNGCGCDTAMIRIHIIGGELAFRAICLWLETLGLQLAARLSRPGDDPLRRSRGRSGCCIVHRSPDDSQGFVRRCIVHRLQGSLRRHHPESFVRGLIGRLICSGAGCGRRHLPVHRARSLPHRPARNRGRDSAGSPGDFAARSPAHHVLNPIPDCGAGRASGRSQRSLPRGGACRARPRHLRYLHICG